MLKRIRRHWRGFFDRGRGRNRARQAEPERAADDRAGTAGDCSKRRGRLRPKSQWRSGVDRGSLCAFGADPGLAADIVAEARGASPNQQSAAGEALAEAQQAYSQAGDQRAAGEIGGAAGFADPQTTASFESAAGYVMVSENDIGRGVGGGANGGLAAGGGGGLGGGGLAAAAAAVPLAGWARALTNQALTKRTGANQKATNRPSDRVLARPASVGVVSGADRLYRRGGDPRARGVWASTPWRHGFAPRGGAEAEFSTTPWGHAPRATSYRREAKCRRGRVKGARLLLHGRDNVEG